MKNIGIIGAGAAGMTAAIFAAEAGAKVTIIERNDRLGKKLLITGKGRCNVTNNSDVNTHIENIPTNPRFMYAALNSFTPYDTMALFEELGVPLKTERGDRVFPVSDRAADICGALKRRLNQLSVEVLHERASHILTRDGQAVGVATEHGQHEFDAVIFATGGASYPLTGSTGDGYKMARELGHTIIEPKPALVPVECAEKWAKELMGLSLKNVNLTVLDAGGNEIYSELGELLFTHFGVSGPLVLSASSHMKGLPNKKYTLKIDLKPALDEATLDKRLQSDFAKYQNRDFINALGDLLPIKLIPVAIMLSGVDGRKKVNVITREERRALLEVIKGLTLTATRFRPIDEAIVTSGGVSVKEISPKTMESKLVSGLYFAGEVIDVDAYTGGFNLQIAFATAHLAAVNAAE
ncbi:MAG: NAD(P)/FAD-dependent oxidoreductase [Clostridiales bacterium]|nr:NAD(P)/FAD-dependent oxidoreductase [Clostridiales bacterium]